MIAILRWSIRTAPWPIALGATWELIHGGTGGLLSTMSALIDNATDGTLVATGISSATLVLVSAMKRAGDRRSGVLDRIEHKIDATDSKVAEHHDVTMAEIHRLGERIARLEGPRNHPEGL